MRGMAGLCESSRILCSVTYCVDLNLAGVAARCLQTASVLPSAPVKGCRYFGLGEAGVLAEFGYRNVGPGGLAQLGADAL